MNRQFPLAAAAAAVGVLLDSAVASPGVGPLHVGALSDAVNVGTVPSWLTVATGGVLVEFVER